MKYITEKKKWKVKRQSKEESKRKSERENGKRKGRDLEREKGKWNVERRGLGSRNSKGRGLESERKSERRRAWSGKKEKISKRDDHLRCEQKAEEVPDSSGTLFKHEFFFSCNSQSVIYKKIKTMSWSNFEIFTKLCTYRRILLYHTVKGCLRQ